MPMSDYEEKSLHKLLVLFPKEKNCSPQDSDESTKERGRNEVKEKQELKKPMK